MKLASALNMTRQDLEKELEVSMTGIEAKSFFFHLGTTFYYQRMRVEVIY